MKTPPTAIGKRRPHQSAMYGLRFNEYDVSSIINASCLHKRKADKRADLIDGIEKTGLASGGAIEVIVPLRELLGAIKHHAGNHCVSKIRSLQPGLALKTHPSYPVVAEAIQSTAAQK